MKPFLKLAVIGSPVLHSQSPQMYRAAMAAEKLEGSYLRLAVKSGIEAVRVAHEMGLHGFNVTSPFKEELYHLSTVLSPEARSIGAVNTALLRDGQIHGFNTDVDGVVRTLQNVVGSLQGKRILLLGAGGAARAAAHGVVQAGAQLTVANRTKSKAEQLALKFGAVCCDLSERALTHAIENNSIIINALSTKELEIPDGLLTKDHVVLESSYSYESTLSRATKASNGVVISGQEWLLEQGKAAFRIFTDQECSSAVMRTALKEPYVRSPCLHSSSVALIGMMGSGKSRVASELSGLLDLEAIDLDGMIEKRAGKSVSGIFNDSGEVGFRELEASTLKEILSDRRIVLATGGGSVLSKASRDLLRDKTAPMWLWASPRELARRVDGDAQRPLLAESLLAANASIHTLEKILADRFSYYAETSALVIPTTGSSPRELAVRIREEILYATMK